MLNSSTRLAAALMLILLCGTVSAQQGGNDTASGGQGGGTADTPTGTLGGGAFTELDREAAFSAVDRSDTIGASENTGQGFSDASVATSGGAGGLGGLGGLGGGFGGLGGFGGFGNLFGGGTTGTQTAKPLIRTRLRSVVDVSPIPPQQRQQIVARRLSDLPDGSPFRRLSVSVSGQTAVISGVVQSDRERRMSELLLRLEPGIRNVDNQVTVAQ